MHSRLCALRFLPLLLGVGLGALLSACSATYYSANAPNVPVFTEKNEVQFSAGAGLSNSTRIINFQGAYSATDHLAFKLNGARFTNLRDTLVSSDGNYGLNGNLIEGSVGWYSPLGNDGFAAGFYGGYGYFFGNTNSLELGPAEFGYNRYFLQPELGFSNDLVDIAGSLKTSLVNFNNVNFAFSSLNPEAANDSYLRSYSAPVEPENYFFLEPALTFRFGYRFLKVQTQVGSSILLSDQSLDYNFLFISAGIVFHFKPSYVGKGPL